jgi:DeoR family fructose operon transcriptional repressor
MFSDERRSKILAMVSQNLSIAVADLARAFDVSPSTIRRDLQQLEDQGLLKRTHGGALAPALASFEPTLEEKTVQYPEAKATIARLALEYIQPGDTILLDAGTTTLAIAQALNVFPLTVITNSLAIAAELRLKKEIQVIMPGGELRPITGSLVGPLAERALGMLHADRLFVGANGVDLVHGITTPNLWEAETKQAMIQAARQVIVVADYSKLGEVSLVKVADWPSIDVLICDQPVPANWTEVLEQTDTLVKTPQEKDI